MSTKSDTTKIGLAVLVGVIVGGVLVGGLLLWQMERRMERYFGKRKGVAAPAASRVLQPRRLRPMRRRLRRPHPRLTRYQERLKRQKWQRLSKRLQKAEGGLLLRLGLLRPEDLQQILGQKKPLRVNFLQGLPRGQYYDALHFRLRDAPEGPTFDGLGVQLWWHRDKEPIESRWLRYQRRFRQPRQAPRATSQPSIGFLSFQRKATRSLVARLHPHNALALITCQVSFCQPNHLKMIALWLQRKIGQSKR